MRRKGRGARGFTLIEVILVITIISILAVASVPAVINTGEIKAETAAKRLVSDLSYIRTLAQTRNATYGISFNAAADTYTAYRVNPTNGVEETILDPMTQMPMVVNFREAPGLAGIDILTPNFGGTANVRFSSPRGVSQNGLGVNLAAAGSVVLRGGNRNRQVSVQAQTGEVYEQ